ncbi:MAG TPA: hypothetical protein VFJ19_13325 [Nocardioidaceae bacterium]|nr:hypothetical protein [Nocardioidaceae bacterium]
MATSGLDVDATASHARRVEGAVHVVLALPEASFAGPQVRLRMRADSGRRGPGRRTRAVRVDAALSPQATGQVLEASVPTHRLRGDIWRMAIRPTPGEPVVRLRARLLVKAGQPVALLPGKAPRTRMPPPPPAGPPEALVRARRRGARTVEATLSRLPDERAARYRAVIRAVTSRLPGRPPSPRKTAAPHGP